MAFAIDILCFGSKRDSGNDILQHYIQLINPYAHFSVRYLKPLSVNKRASAVHVCAQEGDLLCKKWIKNSYPVALSEEGSMFSSKSFAQWIDARKNASQGVIFNIGSAYGLSPDLKMKCKEVISLSPLTMPYRLCLIVLVEQIYRALTILENHPYHKQ